MWTLKACTGRRDPWQKLLKQEKKKWKRNNEAVYKANEHAKHLRAEMIENMKEELKTEQTSKSRIPARAMEEKEEGEVQMQHCEKKVATKKSRFRHFLKLFGGKGKEEKEIEKEKTIAEEEKRKVEEEVAENKKTAWTVNMIRYRIERAHLYITMTETEDPEEKRKLMQQVIAHRIINKIGVPCDAERRNSIPARAMKQKEAVQKKRLFSKFLKVFRRDKTSESETTKLAIVNTNQESQEMPQEEPKSMKHQQEVKTPRTKLINRFFDKDPAEARILCRDTRRKKKEEEQKEIQKERQSCSTTTKLAIVNTKQESQETPREEPTSMKHQEVATRRTELIKNFFDKDPAEARDLMHKMVAQRIIKKVPSPSAEEMRYM